MEINESKCILKGERIEGKNKIMTREGGENFFFNITKINKSKSILKKCGWIKTTSINLCLHSIRNLDLILISAENNEIIFDFSNYYYKNILIATMDIIISVKINNS